MKKIVILFLINLFPASYIFSHDEISQSNSKLSGIYFEYLESLKVEREKEISDFSGFNSRWYQKFFAAISDKSTANDPFRINILDMLATLSYANREYRESLNWTEEILKIPTKPAFFKNYYLTKANLLKELCLRGEVDKQTVVNAYEYVIANPNLFQKNEFYITAWYEYLAFFLKNIDPSSTKEHCLNAIKYIQRLDKTEFLRIYGNTKYTSIERFAELYFEICNQDNEKTGAKILLDSLLKSEYSDRLVLLRRYCKALKLSDMEQLIFIKNTLEVSKEPLWIRNIDDYNNLAFTFWEHDFLADSLILYNKITDFIKQQAKINPDIMNLQTIKLILANSYKIKELINENN